MSGILNKLGLGHSSDSSHSSSSSSSTTSHSTTSHTTGTHGATTSATTGAGYNTVNKTGYADQTATTSSYAHTNPGAVTAQTTTTTTTTTAGNTGAYGTTGVAHTGTAHAASADEYMTRSEERLLVGKEQVGAGVASLNKYVTSEHVHTAVPITREHVVIEREPITAADNTRNAQIGEAHIEVALTEERAVAAKETVAVEKVKLRKEVEHTTQNVDAELRKEHIEFGTTNETTHNKVLGTAPGTAGYTAGTTTTHTTGSNVDPVANPRV